MYRIGLVVLGCLLLACSGNDDKRVENESGEKNSHSAFGNYFTAASLPYQLTDTGLLKNKDTASVPAHYFASLVPDSTAKKIFGKTKGIRYTPLAKIEKEGREGYYVVKGAAGNKVAALLVVMDIDGNNGAVLPFLVPDNDAVTFQTSSIDNSFSITKAIMQRNDTETGSEGKEVLAYDPKEKKFTLIMTDLLHDNPAVLVNPIDTFPKTNKLAGDYYLNKKSLLAVRDGRHANQILVYIHTENSSGECIGELKGEFILTSSTTAVYRQGGDPCILGLTFKGNSVSMNEESGCGNYRGLDCPFSGTFTRKKEEKPKETTKKQKRPKQA